MKKLIFRFSDTIDFESSYVIASNRLKAEEMLKEETCITFVFISSRPLNEFPKAQEHYDSHGDSIWINNILPF